MLEIRTYNKTLPSKFLTSIFDDIFDVPATTTNKPIHDIIENDNEYVLELILAGMKKDNVSINVKNDELIIVAERKEINDLKYNRKQSYFGKYEKSFVLPENINSENINASMEDGILKIMIPKKESNKTVKTIEIM
jgi:HSP20 family protein